MAEVRALRSPEDESAELRPEVVDRVPGTLPSVSPADLPVVAPADLPADPRAVRVTTGLASRMDDDAAVTVDPAHPVASLEWIDDVRAVLVRGEGPTATRFAVLLGPARVRTSDGVVVREVVVDGWRIDVEVELERRAGLRERARRGGGVAGASGPLEVRAIIPGRIVAITVAQGEAVVAGQQILVLEAMKMQNEVRASRDGAVDRIAVAVGENVEVGDLLVVIS